jgi:acyl carrier protein
MTFEALKEIVINTVKTDEAKIALDARLVPDVCKDSLDTVELSMALEDNTGVQVGDDLMATFRTLGDLFDYLNEHGA